MKITINLQTVILLAIIGVMAFFLFRGTGEDLNLYKENYEKQIKERDAGYKRDSINLVAHYDSILHGRNRLLDSANKEAIRQKEISIYFEKKYKQIRTIPISAVDRILDSIFKSAGIK